ncbi:hypothetical protein SPYJRS4_0321 [Streptococcus pyogenes JRS4]|nr:hypothetical protein SPYJRS4_0321 [Streptococcus pyogenes JRS4]
MRDGNPLGHLFFTDCPYYNILVNKDQIINLLFL